MTDLILSFVAGILSTLSPCVLPVLPLVVGASLQKHKLGPIAMASGLAVSFTTLGILISTIGYNIGIETESVRMFAGAIMVVSGIFLVSETAQSWLTRLTAPLAAKAQVQADKQTQENGLKGQFMWGVLLGAIWSPCVGPTLGIAFGLAAQGEQVAYAALIMLIYSIGTALPLLGIAYISKSLFLKNKLSTAAFAKKSKLILGWLIVLLGVGVLTHFDKVIESQLIQILPDWWIDLSARY